MRMDKKCWLCGDLSACWCGKVGVEGGWFIEGRKCLHVPDVRANNWPGTDTQCQGRSSLRLANCPRSSPRTWAQHLARGPDEMHVAAPPTRMSRGLRAHQEADMQVQGPTCEQHTMSETVLPKT